MNIKLMLYGAIIGIANIIPGVSGGTMAVILNIYDKLIQSISNLRTEFKKSLMFLIPIGLGGGIGIVLFSKLIKYALNHYVVPTNLIFVGLILGSIPMMTKKASEDKIKVRSIVISTIFTVIMITMGMLILDESGNRLITQLTPGSFLYLFVTSIIAAGAMIIPGVSGSFILLLLGTYTSILNAISSLNILILIPVALGCVVGILLCAKLLDKLFVKCPQETYSGILGLMIGSVFVLLPEFQGNMHYIVGIFLGACAGIVSYKFSK